MARSSRAIRANTRRSGSPSKSCSPPPDCSPSRTRLSHQGSPQHRGRSHCRRGRTASPLCWTRRCRSDEPSVALVRVTGCRRMRRRVAAGTRSSAGHEGSPRGLRAGRLAKDVRLARLPRVLSDRAALDVPRSAPRGGGPGPRGRAARSAPGHQQVVERRTPWRLCGLQSKRERSNYGVGVLGPADARRAGIGAAALGGSSLVRSC